jgi:hypothetical protein
VLNPEDGLVFFSPQIKYAGVKAHINLCFGSSGYVEGQGLL